MCIQFEIFFWTLGTMPCDGEFERRIHGHSQDLIGILEGGHRVEYFIDCEPRASYMLVPRCDIEDVQDAGFYDDRIQQFCHNDSDCMKRIARFRVAYWTLCDEKDKAEQRRESLAVRAKATRAMRDVWWEWISVYENHKGCVERREACAEWQKLVAAGIVLPGKRYPAEQRLGQSPHEYDEPLEGFERFL
jgi:hypothetical protein